MSKQDFVVPQSFVMDTQTDTETDRQTDRQTETETDRQTDTHTLSVSNSTEVENLQILAGQCFNLVC